MTSGTCTYMIRCTLPCVISRGATPKLITSPATSATTESQPSIRIICASPLEDHVESQNAHHEVDDVGGREQLQPVRDGAERLAEQQALRGFHGGEENGDLDGQEQHREEHLARAH